MNNIINNNEIIFNILSNLYIKDKLNFAKSNKTLYETYISYKQYKYLTKSNYIKTANAFRILKYKTKKKKLLTLGEKNIKIQIHLFYYFKLINWSL